MSQHFDSTTEYYDTHANDFYIETVGVDMTALYRPFLGLLSPGSHILDAGCGSGRDTLYFLRHGHRVTAFDASRKLADMASQLTGIDVMTRRFEELDFTDAFDGIWACASLIHVSRKEIDSVMGRLARALKHDGIMFVSLKLRDGEWEQNGRFFNGYDRRSFEALFHKHPNFAALSVWTSEDVRQERQGEQWLDALLRRVR